MRYYDWGFHPYISVGEKRRMAQKKLMRLKKKNPKIAPLILEGTKLARTWWGVA